MSLFQGAHHAPDAGFGGCDDLAGALGTLADQVGELRSGLLAGAAQVRWTGPAAAGFHDRAGARCDALAQLVRELTASAAVAQSLQCLVAGGLGR